MSGGSAGWAWRFDNSILKSIIQLMRILLACKFGSVLRVQATAHLNFIIMDKSRPKRLVVLMVHPPVMALGPKSGKT